MAENLPEKKTEEEVFSAIGEMIRNLVSSIGGLSTDNVLMLNQSCVKVNDEIGKGRNGTTVFRASYSGQSVALIKIPPGHVVIDERVLNILSGRQHSNVVHNFAVSHYKGYDYMVQELCLCSLQDLIEATLSDHKILDTDLPPVSAYKKKILNVKNRVRDDELWTHAEQTSWTLIKLMRDIVLGIEHLHELDIIHGDIRPENIMIAESNKGLVAKVSDVGMTKCMHGHKACLENMTPSHVSFGWQAPELYLGQHPTKKTDIFSLGCLLFTCLTGGHHPYGSLIEHDKNMKSNSRSLRSITWNKEAITWNKEASDLIEKLLPRSDGLRLKASQVIIHPLFWSPKARMEFLSRVSDTAQTSLSNDANSLFVQTLNGSSVFSKNWKSYVDGMLLDEAKAKAKAKYNYGTVADLLRLIRNYWTHRNQLSENIKALFDPIPVGFERYFSKRFPLLLLKSYLVVSAFYKKDQTFKEYFERDVSVSSQLFD